MSLSIAIVGNPNSGKTTLFNKLTGLSQKVGNWAGVTVHEKSATFCHHNDEFKAVDLPGCYSLVNIDNDSPLDENTCRDFILQRKFDLLVNVVDSDNLSRGLYFTIQLLEQNLPVMVLINTNSKNCKIDNHRLAAALGCRVIKADLRTNAGIDALKEVIVSTPTISSNWSFDYYKEDLLQELDKISNKHKISLPTALTVLEGDKKAFNCIQDKSSLFEDILILQENFSTTMDVVIATRRHEKIANITKDLVTPGRDTITSKIDSIVLDRVLGLPIFFCVMYVLFSFAINLGGIFQPYFESISNKVFYDIPLNFLQSVNAPEFILSIAIGFGKGINTLITFIPVLACLFVALAFLETSGYMARAAFVIDKFMMFLGLPGKSFVPMLVGFGCNVPAVMGARILESPKERIMTILMSPFMSCGARLAIYAVFVTTFFPNGGNNIVFSLYIIGCLAAVMTGLILRRALSQVDSSPLVLDLPSYRLPSISYLLGNTKRKLLKFIFKTGALIVPFCVFISVVSSQGKFLGSYDISILEGIGRLLSPLFSPMGIVENNWPATMGLLTGVMAKEVVVGTLNTLYAGGVAGADLAMDAKVMGIMYECFGSQSAAFAYLLFVLLYFPCISVVAAIVKESNKWWAAFSVLWSTFLAYMVAVAFYQLATFSEHPESSLLWLLTLGCCFVMIIKTLVYSLGRFKFKRPLPTTINLIR